MKNIVDSIKNISKGKKLLLLIILYMFLYTSRWWIINYDNIDNLEKTNSYGIAIILTFFLIFVFIMGLAIYIIENWD